MPKKDDLEKMLETALAVEEGFPGDVDWPKVIRHLLAPKRRGPREKRIADNPAIDFMLRKANMEGVIDASKLATMAIDAGLVETSGASKAAHVSRLARRISKMPVFKHIKAKHRCK